MNQLDDIFDIIVSPENTSDVKSVRVPIWSEKSRKIVWYDAEK
ncbi:hypothetical protein [Enterococcus cecorum]